MKNLLVFLLPMLLIVSCDNIAKHKTAIEELGSKWDETSASVSSFSTMLNGFVNAQNKEIAGFNISEEVMKKLSPEMLESFEGAKSGLMESIASFGPLQSSLGELTQGWSEKAADVQALKDGLAAGKIEGDVAAQVASLTDYMTGATEQFSGLQESFNSAKAASEEKSSAAQTIFKTIMEAATAKIMKK